MQHKQSPAWVIVADNCQARIYRLVKFPKIEEVFYLEHPTSRLHNKDLVTSRPGHGIQRGASAGFSYQSEVEPKQLEAIKFAIDLAKFLSAAEEKGDFGRLYIIAEPSFLGLLRQHITPQIQKVVVAELAKDLIASDVTAIEHHLTEL